MDEASPSVDSRLVVMLQCGLPIRSRPFSDMAAELRTTEDTVLAQLERLFENGQARRFGGIFDAASLGRRTTLCAAIVPADSLDAAGARLATKECVTHCYSRIPYECLHTPSDNPFPALWFTINTPAPAFADALRDIRADLTPFVLEEYPTLKRYKVGVILDPETRRPQSAMGPCAESHITPLGIDLAQPVQRNLVHGLQDTMPLSTTPYADLARSCGCSVDDVLATLKAWQASGALRRIALILRHRRAGFGANAMCVWQVPEARVDRLGRALADLPTVTHCYRRRPSPDFPFDLYAMMHGGTWKSVHAMFENAAEQLGLENGRMLCSNREYRKTSPRYITDKHE